MFIFIRNTNGILMPIRYHKPVGIHCYSIHECEQYTSMWERRVEGPTWTRFRPVPKDITSVPCMLHEFHETCHSVTLFYWSIHTKDESKRGTAFAFIFGVN